MGGEWRTGEEYIGIYLFVGDNVGKLTLIPVSYTHLTLPTIYSV